MRELFFKLFEMSHFDTGISITAFSISHIIYMILIIGGIVAGHFLLRNSTPEKKNKVLGILINLLILSYISDFFVHEFVYGTPSEPGGLNMDKLPFHICTVLCPLSAFVQYNKKFEKIKEPIVILSILAPLMYLCYPASVGEGEPWCYQAVQTMFYHGVQMAWGILTVALGFVKPNIRKCYQSGILLVAITLWATLGNNMMPGNNWFFLEEDAFYIGLVANGVIPQWLLMIINPVVFFLAVIAIYGICYALKALFGKKEKEAVTV